MIFHKLFGAHVADVAYNHWDRGYFVSRCSVCGCEMEKLPGLPWQARARRT